MDLYSLAPIVIAFVVSGAFSPIVFQIIALNGAADPRTMIIILPSCIGAGLSILCNWSARGKGTKHWGFLILLTVIELISAKVTLHGLLDAGSTIFTVCYCSVTMFAALFGRVFLNRHLNAGQWAGIVVINAGLGILMVGAKDDGDEVKMGILLILVGAMIHSFSYVIVEFMLVVAPDPIAPEMLCSILGGLGLVINVAWQLVYTVPRFDSLILDEIRESQGDMWVIVECYLLLMVASGVNSTSFYYLLGTMGSASTGVLKGVQAVATFVTSHYAFCSLQQSQCFTPLKGLSLLVVLCGVMIYSLSVPSAGQDVCCRTEGETAALLEPLDKHTHPIHYSSMDVELGPLLRPSISSDLMLSFRISDGANQSVESSPQSHASYI